MDKEMKKDIADDLRFTFGEEENGEEFISDEELDENGFAEGEGSEISENGLYEHFRFVVDKGQKLLRIDKYLVDRMMGTSRNRVQNAADAGYIFVNGIPVKSNYKVKPLDTVTITLDRPQIGRAHV